MEKFFADTFRLLRQADRSMYGTFLQLMEEEFRREGYREEKSSGVENILIVQLDAIGDMIVMSGLLREVRRNFPQARITLVVSPLVYPIVELCPYVNEVLTFDIKTLEGRGPFNRNFPSMLERLADFCRKHFWKKKISVAFATKCDGDSLPGIVMTYLSGARERIGYDFLPYRRFYMKPNAELDAMGKFFLNRMVEIPATVYVQAEAEFYLLTASGLKVEQNHLELWFSAAEAQRARELLEDLPPECKKIVLGLGAGAPNRKYPPEKLLVALKDLVEKNFAFVIVGGKSELDAAIFLEKNLPREKVLNLAGKTTLRETEAVISQTDFYLGNNTGVMHMAAAAQIPVIAIQREASGRDNVVPKFFNDVYKFPPYQTKSIILRPTHPLGECANSSPLYGGCLYREPHCITQITPQEIVAAVEKMVREI